LQVKLCDPRLSALSVPWCKKALYKYSSFPFSFTAAAWTVGFQWWRSGDVTRTQNVSEYMLVLALCLVSLIITTRHITKIFMYTDSFCTEQLLATASV